MHPVKILCLAGAFGLFSLPALAECQYPNFAYHPERNDGAVVDVKMAADGLCNHSFAEGPGYHFTGISVTMQPKHGKLVRSEHGYTYVPTKGFKGQDGYMIKVCASKDGGGQGCSGIGYVTTVQ